MRLWKQAVIDMSGAKETAAVAVEAVEDGLAE